MIEWVCDRCGSEIFDGDGYVTVNEDLLADHPGKLLAWEAEVLANAGMHARPTPSVMVGLEPPRVHWDVLHRACDPAPERPDLWVPVEHLRSHAEILARTAELIDAAPWLASTNWPALLRDKTAS